MTDRKLIPKESECQQTIVAAAKATGWLCHGERTSRNARGNYSTAIQGDRGFCDLILVKGGQMLALELKRDKTGVIGPGQQEWIDALDAVPGVTARIVGVPSSLQAVVDYLASVP